jgi:hypothetical protein
MSEDFKVFIDDFVDFLNAQESSIVKMKAQIEKLLGSRIWTWNPDKIVWQKTEGWKGEYEKSSDVNNAEFKALLTDLADHKGSLIRDGFFYWTFKNGSTIGRKRKAKA